MRTTYILFLIITWGCNEPNTSFLINDGKSLGNISLGDKLNPNLLEEGIYYKIDQDSIVIELSTNNPKFHTVKGVKVGDDLNVVLKKYGNNYHTLKLYKGEIQIGEVPNVLLYEKITFTIKDHKVNGILINTKN